MHTVVGVMGAGRPLDAAARERAYRIGALIAEHGWTLLTGGSACGVMDAASQGAHEAGGLVIGVLKSEDASEASAWVDIAIRTGMGDARNVINVLSSDVVIALPGGPGTISEVALALKSGKTVIVFGWDPGAALRSEGEARLLHAGSAEEAIALAERSLARETP
jgi:uncharacterized protein (TIGR00725 family)